MANKRVKKQRRGLTNPYGANQYLLDPRQNVCWSYYTDPKSETFSNAYLSAIKAGYTSVSGKHITTDVWFIERVRRLNMLSKAERNLDEFLDLPSKTQAMGAFGPIVNKKTKKPVMVHNASLLNIKQRATEFVAERVGRKRYGQKELPGGNTYNVVIFANEQRTRIAKRIVGGGSISDPASPEQSD